MARKPGQAAARRTTPVVALVALGAVLVALVSARPYAGSWNDGSRLATVESLVDYHTLAIDRSIFLYPTLVSPSAPAPYPRDDRLLMESGTNDKLLVQGRHYSDKSPIPAILMAGVYLALQNGTGLTARARADWFCHLMTVFSSGIAYVAAVTSMYLLFRRLLASETQALLLTASFGLGTVALTYARHVNSHAMLLGVVALLLLGFQALGERPNEKPMPWTLMFGLGGLSGLGYCLDLGAGPVLLISAPALATYRCGNIAGTTVFVGGALPWVVAHHAVNYYIGRTILPANTVSTFLSWPGSPFDQGNLTGTIGHESLWHVLSYALQLLVGKKGFLLHNPPLLMAVMSLPVLLGRGRRVSIKETPELLFAATISVGTWAVYSVMSTNYSGACASVRWFVPLLAPLFYVLAIYVRERPLSWPSFLALASWSLVMALIMWWKGPWMARMVPLYWLWVAAAIGTWIVTARCRPRRSHFPVKS
jgi:hypothetical protein